jgi:hypothetical protein
MTNLQELLKTASQLNIQLVGIKMTHPLLKGSESFPWPSSSLFANGRDNWGCLVWTLAKQANVWGGCGNSYQAQIKQYVELPAGVWQLQADGWVQIR